MKKLFKEHDLATMISIMLIVLLVLSWIIPTGSFGTDGTFTQGEIGRIGLIHIFYFIPLAFQSCNIQIIYLLFVGLFYGVVTKTEKYKAFVSRISEFAKGKEIVFALVISLLLAGLTSVLSYPMALILFIPFIIHILHKMGFDKISTFATTFGAMLVGILSPTIGTESLLGLVNYLGAANQEITIETELVVRIGILLLAFILYSFFQITYIKKMLKNKKKEEVKEEDVFVVDNPKKKRNAIWPMILLFGLLLAIIFVAFVPWQELGITYFKDLHNQIMDFKLGDFEIFHAILGAPINGSLEFIYELFTPFGQWYLWTLTVVIGLATILVGICSKMSLTDFFSNVWEGMKKVARPVAFLVFAYMVFMFVYASPFLTTILNEIGKLDSLTGNVITPVVTSLQSIVASIFTSDLSYTGYTLMYHLATFTGAQANVMFLVHLTVYGLVQFVTPISVFLIFGLAYMNIPYKNWLQYIWKFLLGMLVCLLVIFMLLAYI